MDNDKVLKLTPLRERLKKTPKLYTILINIIYYFTYIFNYHLQFKGIMSSILSFGRALGSAALEEAVTFLPGIACTAVATPLVSKIIQVSAGYLSIKAAYDEYAKEEPWSLNRTAKVLYHAGMAALTTSQALSYSVGNSFILGAVATAMGAARLYVGYHQVKQGLGIDHEATRERALARGIVSTISGGFNLARGVSAISSSLPVLRQKARIEAHMDRLGVSRRLRSAWLFGVEGVPLMTSTIRGSKIDDNLAQLTLHAIQKTSAPGVSFSGDQMLPWTPGGTCSARALDFLARHAETCSLDVSAAEQVDCIASLWKYYEQSGLIFQSRQAAFDTIAVNVSVADSETLKTAKMASLAALHNLQIQPMTERSLQRDTKTSYYSNCWNEEEVPLIYEHTYDMFSMKELLNQHYLCSESKQPTPFEKDSVDKINKLPFGRYLIRGLHLEDNHKQEHHGHSMGLVKSTKGSFFFDPDSGTNAIIRDVGKHVTNKIIEHSYWLTEFRIYQVFCGEGGCTNLAPEVP